MVYCLSDSQCCHPGGGPRVQRAQCGQRYRAVVPSKLVHVSVTGNRFPHPFVQLVASRRSFRPSPGIVRCSSIPSQYRCSRPHTVIEYVFHFHLKITSDIHWISDTNRRDSDPIDGSSLLGSSRAEQYPAPVDAALGRGSDDFNKPLVCSIIGSG